MCGGFDSKKLMKSVSNAILYDVADGEAIHLPNMLEPRSYHGICRVGSRIYCCGGLHKNGKNRIRTCETFDLATEEWTILATNLPVGLAMQTLLTVDSFWIYSFGGITDNASNLQLLRLDTRTSKKWECLPTSQSEC